MMKKGKHIPVYSLNEFRNQDRERTSFQVEVFDANRHFRVSYPHKHDFYEILFLTKGSGYHIIDNNKYSIEPPTIFFMSPGQAHKLELSNDIEGYIFLFTSAFYLSNQKNKNRLLEFPFFFSINHNNPPLLLYSDADIRFLETIFKKGCMENSDKAAKSEEVIRSILDLILLTCDGLYPERYRSVQKGKGQIVVKNFLSLLEENYQKNLRVNDYAEMLAITPNHLTQLVKEITGKTSAAIIQEKLVTETKRMLLYSEMTVSEIAELFHFPDQSYFTKYFKKVAGITPLSYRKKSMKYT